jgi:hypothetical protein
MGVFWGENGNFDRNNIVGYFVKLTKNQNKTNLHHFRWYNDIIQVYHGHSY